MATELWTRKTFMTDRSPFLVSTAISYPNGVPHIGHAYEAIATDTIARFQRLDGRDVLFLTGTDEHGQKMLQTARGEGIPVRELADRNAARFQEMVAALGCSNDDFIRTVEPRHHAASQEIWRRMAANFWRSVSRSRVAALTVNSSSRACSARAYKKARPASLARIFEPKFPQIPAEIIPIIVEFSFRTY